MSEQQDERKYEVVEEFDVGVVVHFRVRRTDLTPAEGIDRERIAQQIAQQIPHHKEIILVGRHGAPIDKVGFFEIETMRAWPLLWPINKYEIRPKELSDDDE